MAKNTGDKAGLLTDAQRAELQRLTERIEKSKRGLSLLKKLGIGVADLEDKIRWAEKQQQILLDEG